MTAKKKTDKKKIVKKKTDKRPSITKSSGIKKPKRSPKKVDLVFLNDRSCTEVKSLKNPTAYAKPELVDLAVKKLKMTKVDASRMTKIQLCVALKSSPIKISKVIKIHKVKSPKKSLSSKSAEKKSKKAKKTKTALTSPKSTPKKTSPKHVKPSPAKLKKKSATKLKKKSATKGGCIDRSKIKLHHHQKVLVNHLKTHRGIIAAFEVGTGKTLTAVTASQCFLDSHPKGKVIVVTPKSLQDNFRKEIIAYGANPDTKRYEIITIGKFVRKYEFGITSTDKRPIMLVIDEAHEERSPKSKRTKIAVLCSSQVAKVLLLTATPTFNNPEDILPLVAMVKGSPQIMGVAKFQSMSTQEKCDYFSDTIMLYENPKSSDYPETKEITVKIPMDKAYYKAYRRIETQKDHLFTEGNPFRFLGGVRLATNGISPYPKRKWIVDKILEGDKTVVFSAFLEHGIKLIKKELKAKGVKYVEVSGKKSAESRNRAVRRYNSDKARVLIITKAGGLGLDLKGTRNVILTEKTWNKPTETQIIGRAARYKSHAHLKEKHRTVNVYHLVLTKPPIKERDSDDKRKLRGSGDEMLEDIIIRKARDNAEFRKLLKAVDINAPAGTKCPPMDYVDIVKKKKKSPAKKTSAEKQKAADKKAAKKIANTGPKVISIVDKRPSYNRPPVTDAFKKLVNLALKKSITKYSDADITQTTANNTIKFEVPGNTTKKAIFKASDTIINELRSTASVSQVQRLWTGDNIFSVVVK